MKHVQLLYYIFLLSTCFTFSNCKTETVTIAGEQLPPETQTGANTFGCLIDGKVFIPKGDPLGGPVKKAAYQFVNGGFYFLISGGRSDDNSVSSVSVFADSLQLSVGTYHLTSRDVNGKLSGQYVFSSIGSLGTYYYTNEINTGELTITKFDEINQIVSGTFWFDAKDTTTGNIVKVTMGRFDMPFVR